MVIIEERKTKQESNSSRISLQDFYRLIGKKTRCMASWTSKAGYTTVTMSPPAFCGVNSGLFYLTTGRGDLSVTFPLRVLGTAAKEEFDDGMPTQYTLYIKDGTQINLEF